MLLASFVVCYYNSAQNIRSSIASVRKNLTWLIKTFLYLIIHRYRWNAGEGRRGVLCGSTAWEQMPSMGGKHIFVKCISSECRSYDSWQEENHGRHEAQSKRDCTSSLKVCKIGWNKRSSRGEGLHCGVFYGHEIIALNLAQTADDVAWMWRLNSLPTTFAPCICPWRLWYPATHTTQSFLHLKS